MGLYKTFISLILFSMMGLSFIHIIQVKDMELKGRQLHHQSNTSQAHANLFKPIGFDRVQRQLFTQTSDGPDMFTKQTDGARQATRDSQVKFTALTSRMHVFGVYLDHRFHPKLFLRILILQRGHNLTERLACGVGVETFNAWADKYEMCENHGKLYSGWIYSCLIPQYRETKFNSVMLSVYSYEGPLINRQEFPVVFLRMDMMPPGSSLSSQSGIKSFWLDPVSSTTKRDNFDQNLRQRNNERDNFDENLRQRNNERDNFDENIRQRNNERDNFDENIRQRNNERDNFDPNISIRQRNNVSIGVCIPPLHGNIYIPNLIHFLDISWLLGANKVFLYNFNLPRDLLDTLRLYFGEKSNLLDTVNWDLPADIKSKTYQVIWNNGQLLAAQHCLYQNMAQFDWLLFLDIDEMLIPRKVFKWQDLLQTLLLQNSGGDVAAFTFESAFFTQGFDSQGSKPIKYFQHLYRTKRTSRLYSKLLVRPEMVFEVGIHHLSRAIQDSMRVIKVPSDAALLHHYRACVKREAESVHCELLVKDIEALKYEPQMMATSNNVKRWLKIMDNETKTASITDQR